MTVTELIVGSSVRSRSSYGVTRDELAARGAHPLGQRVAVFEASADPSPTLDEGSRPQAIGCSIPTLDASTAAR